MTTPEQLPLRRLRGAGVPLWHETYALILLLFDAVFGKAQLLLLQVENSYSIAVYVLRSTTIYFLSKYKKEWQFSYLDKK